MKIRREGGLEKKRQERQKEAKNRQIKRGTNTLFIRPLPMFVYREFTVHAAHTLLDPQRSRSRSPTTAAPSLEMFLQQAVAVAVLVAGSNLCQYQRSTGSQNGAPEIGRPGKWLEQDKGKLVSGPGQSGPMVSPPRGQG